MLDTLGNVSCNLMVFTTFLLLLTICFSMNHLCSYLPARANCQRVGLTQRGGGVVRKGKMKTTENIARNENAHSRFVNNFTN